MTDDEYRKQVLIALQAIPAAIGAEAEALRELVERLCPPPSSKPPSSRKRGGA